MIVEVIINRTAKRINRSFDYQVPIELEELITIGAKVVVPFGKGKSVCNAFVTKIKNKSEYVVKEIVSVETSLDDNQMNLAKWMSNRYFCGLSECIKLMLEPGSKDISKINSKYKTSNNKNISSTKEKIIKYVKISPNKKDNISDDIEKLKSEKHKEILKYICLNKDIDKTISDLEKEINCTRSMVNTLIKNGYLILEEKNIRRDPLVNKNIEKIVNDKKILNDEQILAYTRIEKTIDNNIYDEFLIYGVTGSRKN